MTIKSVPTDIKENWEKFTFLTYTFRLQAKIYPI